jgi:hypothetical protein
MTRQGSRWIRRGLLPLITLTLVTLLTLASCGGEATLLLDVGPPTPTPEGGE